MDVNEFVDKGRKHGDFEKLKEHTKTKTMEHFRNNRVNSSNFQSSKIHFKQQIDVKPQLKTFQANLPTCKIIVQGVFTIKYLRTPSIYTRGRLHYKKSRIKMRVCD